MLKNIFISLYFVLGGLALICINIINILSSQGAKYFYLLSVLIVINIILCYFLARKEFMKYQASQDTKSTKSLLVFMMINAVLILLFLYTKNELLLYFAGLLAGSWLLFFGSLGINHFKKT
ncbi:MAG: hypothetical protein KF758_14225 [Anaerolineales bacterium]|nr:hypothetical protein [Anaerolineales bacterium]MBX3038064.1 hypothetical protein [Anaerolineales bacterium]